MRLERVIRSIAILSTLALTQLFSGCVSQYATRLSDVRRDFYEYGEPELARSEIEARRKRAPEREQSVWKLNEASVDLSTGRVKEAKAKLVAARNEFDDLEAQAAKKAAEDVLQYWADDAATSYEGEDYEKVMIRATLAIADLLDDGEDARAYAKQIAAKQDEIVMRGQLAVAPNSEDPARPRDRAPRNPKLSYPRVPLGPYLEGLLYEETYLDANEAARRYEQVVKWRPQFKQGQRDLARAREGVHSAPGNGRLYVFAFVGKGPHKIQGSAEVTQMALLVADQIFSATNKYSVPPTLAPVPIPELVVDEPRVAALEIDVDGECVGATETIADVNEMAIKQFEATKDQIIARAVVRRIVKKGTLYAAKEVAQVNDWVSLAIDAGGVIWEATETADARCWGLLPAKIQVYSLELPAGEHRIAITPTDHAGRKIGAASRATVSVPANRNAYALITCPDLDPLGDIVVSNP